MALVFRLLLIIVSILTTLYMLRKIRQAKLQIEYAIFWLIFAGLLIIFSIFPWIVNIFTNLIGMQAPVNFIFLFVIFILLMKLFLVTIELSQLEYKVKELAQKMAIEEKLKRDEEKENCIK